MGFSQQQYRKAQQERKWKINPAWRGIGCILLLIIPIMSWVGAVLVLQSNLTIPLPFEMKQIVVIPFTHVVQIDKVIQQVNQYFQSTGFVTGQLFLTVIFLFVGYGILAFLYSILYRMAGPPRYGPFDVPPDSVKRYK
jgi:hypothetical protein